MDSGAFRGLGETMAVMFFGMAALSILGLWKLGELVYWLVTHVRVMW